ncbi:AcvB/VirJ family lysyl-phosphatidylglycerol hydrolase [Tistrella sp. BH-R2-4]|uniref:AcvB/VirJ family lysyl-phosphatidylglycerol hydrolase n=1 Tax=Tistrella arctica TaxID=3133430 RepID=A0ABU9YGF2_9PROT
MRRSLRVAAMRVARMLAVVLTVALAVGDGGVGLTAAETAAAMTGAIDDPAAAHADWLVDLPAGGAGGADGAGGVHGRDLAVIISGDGGWADLDRDMGARLQARGVAVLGVDALHYFWTRRSAADAARDLAGPIADRMARWHRDRLVLIGFSFGAAVLPAIAADLPPALLDRAVLGVMLTSNTWANWEIHPTNWLHDTPEDGATDVVAAARALARPPLLCVYGLDEANISACPRIGDRATVLGIPGGHHFDGDYDRLADLVLAQMDGR